MRTVVWFRGKDLRLADHEPLTRACASGEVIPLFVLDPFFFAPERAGRIAHRMQVLVESLAELARRVQEKGSELVVVAGRSVDVVPALADAWRADRVVASSWVAPVGRARDRRVAQALGERFMLFDGETLAPPGSVRTKGGAPYSVFSAFARAFRAQVSVADPLPEPSALPPLPPDVTWERAPIPTLAELGLTRNARIAEGGELAARARLAAFLDGAGARYDGERDRMDLASTSRLSIDLKFGTLSARQVYRVAERRLGTTNAGRVFMNELLWREFAHHTLFDRPSLLRDPFRADFVGFPWRGDGPEVEAWRQGRTGYPVVDAAARQLLAEGFVHNRARMIAASFLTKHLLADFRLGEAHYLRYLADGDWAQNDMGWQWSAGCGCDAQPYFRVFNPVTQGEKFDPDGDYVRRWVPELARMPARFIHAPWAAPPAVLAAAGVTLGATYPRPIVDHDFGRRRFLDAAREHLGRAAQAGAHDRDDALP